MNIKLTTGQADFLHGLLIVVVGAVGIYLNDPSHLQLLGIPSGIAILVAGILSYVQGQLKLGGTALLGLVSLK